MLSALIALAIAAPATPTLAAGWYGDMLVHPGAAVRAGWGLHTRVHLAVSWELQGAVFWHPNLMVSSLIRSGPALVAVGPRHGRWGLFAHVGGQAGVWTSPTWVVEAGEARRGAAGDVWVHAAFGVELGRDLLRGPLQAWFIRPSAALRAPTFHGHGVDLVVEVGVQL